MFFKTLQNAFILILFCMKCHLINFTNPKFMQWRSFLYYTVHLNQSIYEKQMHAKEKCSTFFAKTF